MNYEETMEAIEALKQEAGLNTLEEDMEQIEGEMQTLANELLKTWNEISAAKYDGLKALLEDKERKKHLNLDLSPSFIMGMVKDEQIKYPIMVKALVITYLRIQNGTNKKKAMAALKGSLANAFIELHGISKTKAGKYAAEMADIHINPKAATTPFNAKRKGDKKVLKTDFGFILKLP